MTTTENNKRIAKNTMLLYIRMFFTMAVGFYTSRVVLNALGVVDFGIYNVVGGIVGMLAVLNGSMAGATQRWITIALGKGDEDNLKKVFSVGLTAQAIIALIVLLLTETIGLWYLYNYAVIPPERMEVSFWVFQISVLTMTFDIMNVPFIGAIMAHEKMGAFALFSITDVIMKLLICVVLYITVLDKLFIYASLIFLAFVINFIFMQIYCHRKFIEARIKFGWDKIMYKEMWSLAFWTISGNLAFVGYSQGLTLLINMFFGPAMNAAAGVANQAGNIVNQFSANFQVAMNPQITKNYATENYAEMNKLVFRSAKFSYFLMLLFAIPLFFEANLLLKLWLKNVPDHSVNFLRIGLFLSMFIAVRNPLVVSAMANGRIKKYQFVVNGILLMVCPISYLFLKFGAIPETTSIVFLCVMIIAVFASAFMLKEMTQLNFNDFVQQVIYKIVLVTILSFIIPAFIFYSLDEGFIRLIILTLISTLLTSILIYFWGLSASEKEFSVSMTKNILNKMRIK